MIDEFIAIYKGKCEQQSQLIAVLEADKKNLKSHLAELKQRISKEKTSPTQRISKVKTLPTREPTLVRARPSSKRSSDGKVKSLSEITSATANDNVDDDDGAKTAGLAIVPSNLFKDSFSPEKKTFDDQ